MYNNFSSKKTKKVISALLASALVVTSAPITADAATTKVLGINKTYSKTGTKVSGLSKSEKKIVKVSINKKKKKVTVKGLKPGKATFKIGKKSYTFKVGAVKIKAKSFKTTLTEGTNKTVTVTASYGAKDKLAWSSSDKKVVKVKTATTTASSKKVGTNKLIPVAAGKATITVKSKNTGKSLKVKVTVKAKTTPTTAPTATATGGAVTTPSVAPTANVTATPDATTGSATTAPTATATATATATGGATTAPTTAPTATGSATTAPTTAPTATPDSTEELKAVTASAISTNKIAFKFNKAVTASAIKADTVIVTETSERKFVKSVSADEKDAKTVIVELYDNLTDKKTYNVSIPVDGKAYALDVAYAQASAGKIVVEDQIVPAGTEKAIKYTVLDANGLDITDVTKVTFTSNVSTIKDGKITLANDKDTAFVQVETVLADGTTVKSDRFTVTAQARVATTLANYTTSDKAVKFDATDYAQDLNVLENAENVKIYTQIKDQFGDDMSADKTTYESLDTTVAVVDKTTGAIIPLKVGSVPVKITNGSFSKTVVITIVTKAKEQKLVVEKTALTIYPELADKTASTKVYTEDQYGKKYTADIVAKVISGEDLIAKAAVTEGVLTVTASAIKENNALKTGTAVVQLTKGDFTQNVVITIDKLGAVVGYEAEGTKATLDKNSSDNKTATNYNADQMTFKLNPVDKDGKIAGNPSKFNYEIKESNTVVASGSAVEELTIKMDQKVNEKATDVIKKDKTYTVTLKVESLTVKTFQFNTVDTRVAPAVTIAKTAATVSATSGAGINGKDALATVLNQAGVITTDKNCTLSNLDFVSADTTIVDKDGKFQSKYDEKVSLTLKSVDVTNAKGEKFTVTLSGTVDLTVSKKTEAELAAVAKVEAKAAAEKAISTLVAKYKGVTVENVAEKVTDKTYIAEATAADSAVEKYVTAGGKVTDLTGNALYTAITAQLKKNVGDEAVQAKAKQEAEGAISTVITEAKVTSNGGVVEAVGSDVTEIKADQTAITEYAKAYPNDVKNLKDYANYKKVLELVAENAKTAAKTAAEAAIGAFTSKVNVSAAADVKVTTCTAIVGTEELLVTAKEKIAAFEKLEGKIGELDATKYKLYTDILTQMDTNAQTLADAVSGLKTYAGEYKSVESVKTVVDAQVKALEELTTVDGLTDKVAQAKTAIDNAWVDSVIADTKVFAESYEPAASITLPTLSTGNTTGVTLEWGAVTVVGDDDSAQAANTSGTLAPVANATADENDTISCTVKKGDAEKTVTYTITVTAADGSTAATVALAK